MKNCIFLAVLFILLSILNGGVSAENLKVAVISEKDISPGLYTVILHGSRHGNDLETIAYLDPLNDDYEIELDTPAFDYRKELSKQDKDALNIAKTFVSWHSSFMQYKISRLLTKEGKKIGYEIKPLYMPFEYGRADVFDISYWLRGKKAVISIKLIPSVDRLIYDSGRSRDNE